MIVSAGLGGCQHVANTAPEMTNDTLPLAPDAALNQRIWDQSTARYANGATVSGSTGFFYAPRQTLPGWQQLFVDPALFIGQSVALPVTLLISPRTQSYSGAVTGPTYTAAPPLPAGEVTVQDSIHASMGQYK